MRAGGPRSSPARPAGPGTGPPGAQVLRPDTGTPIVDNATKTIEDGLLGGTGTDRTRRA